MFLEDFIKKLIEGRLGEANVKTDDNLDHIDSQPRPIFVIAHGIYYTDEKTYI